MNLFLMNEEPPQEVNKTVLYSLVYRPPFWFHNCLNSLWHWLNKLLETRRCAILLEAAVGKQGTLWSQRDGHGRQQCSGKLWCLRNSELGLRGTKWAKKISHTPQIWWIHAFMMVTPNSDSAILMSQQQSSLNISPGFYCPILVSPCKLKPQYQ